jgi:hypothetical protein
LRQWIRFVDFSHALTAVLAISGAESHALLAALLRCRLFPGRIKHIAQATDE